MALFTHKDFAILPDFLTTQQTLALRLEAQSLFEQGKFKTASVGKDRVVAPERRGDLTFWWELRELTPAQRVFIDKMNELREALNRTLFLGLHDWEGHYTFYPPGTHYERHIDRFHNDDKRVLSTVFYLNEKWKEDWGGELVLHLAQPKTISPQGGTLALFLSDRITHEVLEAKTGRWSIAGWFRRRN